MFNLKRKKNKNKKVFIGISGGVDSSVSAALLKKQGYGISGVFFRTWQPDWIECTWREERRDAMRVCASLDIPFIELDLEKEYKKEVADYMIDEYKKGRTPNPDIMCNKKIKFGAFLKWAIENGADFIATGHYTKKIFNKETKKYGLHRGKDILKDQSYFLWTLGQKQLKNIIFPIGNLKKKKVRKLAKKFKLHTASKKDSQGICFLGKIDMKDFLSHYIEEKKGDVLNESGEVIGFHGGALFFTLGERHNFTIIEKGTYDKPYYVIGKDIEKNTITVSQNLQKTSSEKYSNDKFSLENLSSSYFSSPSYEGDREIYKLSNMNLIDEELELDKKYEAQIRYHGEIKKIEFKNIDLKNNTVEIIFEKEDKTIAKGQSVVFYDEKKCLGGGIVE